MTGIKRGIYEKFSYPPKLVIYPNSSDIPRLYIIRLRRSNYITMKLIGEHYDEK